MNLVQCPDCLRQYDVGNLPPKAKVRSVCGKLLEVTWSRPMEVEILSCAHCGGAVQATDATCPWCDGTLSERDRQRALRCPSCYTRMDSDSRHCHACGVRIEAQALTPLPAEGGCPRCEGELAVRFLGEGDAIECTACGGLWLKPSVLEKIHRHATAHGREQGPFDNPAPLPIEPNIRYLPCLTCGQLMARRQFRHGQKAVGVVIDLCRDHGIWLDPNELERIVAYVHANPYITAEAPKPLSGTAAKNLALENWKNPLASTRHSNPLIGALRMLGDILTSALHTY